MAPFPDEVKKLTEELIPLKETLKALKKGKTEKEAIAALEEVIKTKEKSIREAQAKATDIDAAVYDLKAVNPKLPYKIINPVLSFQLFLLKKRGGKIFLRLT